jgi:hypothetical protein
MTETQMVRDSRMRPDLAQATTADRPDPDHPGRPDHRRRARRMPGRVIARLRGLLRAQALLDGTVGGPYDVAFIEDDRRRLSGRRAR